MTPQDQNKHLLEAQDEWPLSEMKKTEEHPNITIIAAASTNNALGKDNDLIWHIREDLLRFKQLTQGHAIIMGRKTFESLPKVLPNRKNIIITRNPNYTAEGAFVCDSLEAALALAEDDPQPFIIGGGKIYRLGMAVANTIELTRVHQHFEADTFFPKIDPALWEETHREEVPKSETQTLAYAFITYKRKENL